MSLPNIPNITPTISLSRCESIDLLLSSIALEEMALSHILNAEGEKLQAFLKNDPKCLNDYLRINENVNQTLKTIIKSQIMLQLKLEDVMTIDSQHHCDCTRKKTCSKKGKDCKSICQHHCICKKFENGKNEL
ncbi:hypothetical protein [Litoribacterium kuwaitense]|uniref:hypothetical protein n=1 Tax=Litoribacterium kuwaitense TaxID=1398745 RepID=UPI001BA4D972|nr:hypothetical protein [Litoribacterium kuwaitense]